MTIHVSKLIRTQRKTIALVIEPDGNLTVRAPLHIKDYDILKFVDAHSEWINKNQAKARRNAPPPARKFIAGERFPYLGESHSLRFTPGGRPSLILDQTGFRMARNSLPKAEKVFINWYKKQLLVILSEKVETQAKCHGFNYQRIRISSARTRWGSCSSKGTLSFTWRLVLAPPEIIDYVVIHELVHTKIKNHSKTFWRRVEEIMPGFKVHVRWLKQNGKFLTL